MKPKKPETPAQNQPQQQQQQKQEAADNPAASAAAPVNVSSGPVTQAAAESTTVVENDLYRITFTNRGAQVTSWVLKKYKDDDGKPLDLVNHAAAAKYGYPLSLYTYDAKLRSQLQQALFVPSATGSVKAPGTL